MTVMSGTKAPRGALGNKIRVCSGLGSGQGPHERSFIGGLEAGSGRCWRETGGPVWLVLGPFLCHYRTVRASAAASSAELPARQ